MTTSRADEILQQALALSDEERARIGQKLLESVYGEEPEDAELTEELLRRERAMRDGTGRVLSEEEFLTSLRRATRGEK